MGTIIATKDIEKKGMSGDSNTNASGESGSGEPGGVGECGEHGKTVMEVCQTLNAVHRAQWWGLMQKLPGETLWVFARAAEGGHGRQRWTVGVPTDKGGSGESDEGAGKEGPKTHYTR